jgi:WD40 repeat protein
MIESPHPGGSEFAARLSRGGEVEVAHETLIRRWPRLRQWLDEDRVALLLRESIRDAAREWRERQGEASYLVHRGRRLDDALALRQHPRVALNETENAYLDAGLALRRQEEQREVEAARRLAAEAESRRAAEADARAQAEQRAVEQAQAAGRLRHRLLAAVGLGAAALLAAIVALVFFQRAEGERRLAVQQEATAIAAASTAEAERQRADDEADRAEAEANIAFSRQLQAQAVARAADQLDLAALLSLEANHLWDSPESRGAIFNVLTANPRLERILPGHERVSSVAFNPEGNILATGSFDATVMLWDAATGRRLGPVMTQDDDVTGLAFSRDGKTLASAGSDGQIMLWRVDTAQPRDEPLRGHDAAVNAVAFSPAGDLLASGGSDGRLILWKPDAEEPPEEFPIGYAGIDAVDFSSDGALLAIGMRDGYVLLWDTETRQPVPRGPFLEHTGAAKAVAISPDNRILASGGVEGDVALWDIANAARIGRLNRPLDAVFDLSFAPDGKTLAVSHFNGSIALWNIDTREQETEPLTGLPSGATSVAFAPDGTLAVGTVGGETILWDLERRQRQGQVMRGLDTSAQVLAFSPDGETVVSGGIGGELVFWDVAARQASDHPQTGHVGGVTALAFSHDGRTLASGGENGQVILWDAQARQPRPTGPAADIGPIAALGFGPDDNTLVGAGQDGTVARWDLAADPSPATRLFSLPERTAMLALSADLSLLAVHDPEAAAISVFDVATGLPRGDPMPIADLQVFPAAFGAGGQLLAVTRPGTILVWDIAAARRHDPLVAEADVFTGLAFDPEGQILASGSVNGAIVLWDVASGLPVTDPVAVHASIVKSLAFSPDGNTLVSASLGGDLVLWDVSPDSWRSQACALAGRNLTPEEWGNFMGDAPYRETCAAYARVPPRCLPAWGRNAPSWWLCSRGWVKNVATEG